MLLIGMFITLCVCVMASFYELLTVPGTLCKDQAVLELREIHLSLPPELNDLGILMLLD